MRCTVIIDVIESEELDTFLAAARATDMTAAVME
jgi:hypothetical protein